MFSVHVREGKERESEELERQIQMDAIFDLWENISVFYLPAKNQITTEQTPSTQITSQSNLQSGKGTEQKNERKTDIQKEKEREQEGQERMMEGNGEIGKEKFKRKKWLDVML